VVRALFVSLQGSVQLLLGVLGTIGLISVLVGNSIFILEPQTFANDAYCPHCAAPQSEARDQPVPDQER